MNKVLKVFLIFVASLVVISVPIALFTDEEEVEKPVVANAESDKGKAEELKKPTFKEKAIANAEKHPASAAKILYGSEFKGMEYYFEGEVIGFIIVEGNNSALVKNDKGYVMPINPFENDLEVGQTVKVYGNLSGDGYANKDLGVDNVVGMTGYINTTIIE